VGDDSTGRLMARFYGGLAAGLGAGEALRQAQAEAAAAGEHPFGWAAWALYGEG
jgi:CHAT domain-containing protein